MVESVIVGHLEDEMKEVENESLYLKCFRFWIIKWKNRYIRICKRLGRNFSIRHGRDSKPSIQWCLGPQWHLIFQEVKDISSIYLTKTPWDKIQKNT